MTCAHVLVTVSLVLRVSVLPRDFLRTHAYVAQTYAVDITKGAFFRWLDQTSDPSGL